MSNFSLKNMMTRQDVLGFLVLAILLLVIMPLSMDIIRLTQFGKYLSFAFVAVGLVLCWGYGGILSLGQGVFYGLGGYALAMFLKLEASSPENTAIQSTPGIPDFMDWNRITELPWFWEPFNSFTFSVLAILIVPTIFAYFIGFAMFKRRVGGVYFAIITQAISAILTILIIGQQGYTGGVNGITDLRTLLGWNIRSDYASYVFYFVCVALLFVCLFIAQFITKSKLGRILVAMRGQEDRVRFSGYDVANFKIFVFCVGAAFAAVGGAMFTLQEKFMSPSFVGIVPSIEMVIFCAVGGRLSILGAVYGAIVVNVAKTYFGESFPELWLFAMGALFIGVVLAFPDGLAGVYQKYCAPTVDRFLDKAPVFKRYSGDSSYSPSEPAKAS
ncbi:urea ABC transporter permease subunit UrtC [Marinobacter confluentis]|uniref:Urea ABC transporter permease subunit UrtC n=1 Tax=Marinobacter confluentis TaxID=1697557 RepID=A0A4Z1BYC8_9GAMM|nr:urea ABC transporter permease subunit UrtC [Marinobacter confluentis]TGN39530.1 urea ABC transporter permease subunit UrtC [Marinobacter confluentis]